MASYAIVPISNNISNTLACTYVIGNVSYNLHIGSSGYTKCVFRRTSNSGNSSVDIILMTKTAENYYAANAISPQSLTTYSFPRTMESSYGYQLKYSKYTSFNLPGTIYPPYSAVICTEEEALLAMDDDIWDIVKHPITYSYTNSTVSGPTEAAIGDTVIVSAVPDVDYGITDASSQIIVTNNDVAVPYTWDAANQHITFTMPDPT